MAETLRVKGYRETARALNRVDKESKRALYKALKEAAQPIADEAKRKLAQYPGIKLGTIGPRAVVRGVYVTQRAKKVTGLHPDFGALQMERGLIPALEEHEGDVVSRVEDAFDSVARSQGF